MSNPELQTKRSIKELNEDFLRFRKDISYISNAKNVQELERAIEEYYKGGDIKNIADRNGIKPVDEYDKLAKLMEVIDLKDGLKFNNRTGEYEPILDDGGNRIRYRSLEEAYKINNYYDEINKARKQAFKDVNNKLTTLQNAPVTLPQTVTTSLDEHYTTEQMREILNMPVNQWKNDPRKRQMVEKVYSDLGIPLPKVK
jgi:septal ring factor EnvC (AmiA/AmiB activator)